MRRILPRHIGSAACRRQPAFPWAAPWSPRGLAYPALPPAEQLCELVVVSRPYVYRRSATLRAVCVPCQSICYRSRGESLTSCGRTQNVVIPRHAACRGISLFLCFELSEIPGGVYLGRCRDSKRHPEHFFRILLISRCSTIGNSCRRSEFSSRSIWTEERAQTPSANAPLQYGPQLPVGRQSTNYP